MRRTILAMLAVGGCRAPVPAPPLANVAPRPQRCTIGGTVTDVVAREPLAGATIVIDGHRSALSDEHGRFAIDVAGSAARLDLLWADTHLVRALPRGACDVAVVLRVRPTPSKRRTHSCVAVPDLAWAD